MNNTCPQGYSNADELALREISDCSVYDKCVQYVFICNATAGYALALFSLLKTYPLVEKRKLNLTYIPHTDLVCWGIYGLSSGGLFTFKAIKLNKVSEANASELMYHSIALVFFSPAVWLFLYTLMAAACSAEIGAHAALLRTRLWLISKFFMISLMLVHPMPYWLAVACPSCIQAASICIVLVILSIVISVGCTTAVSAYALSSVLTGVMRQERRKSSFSGGTTEIASKSRLQKLKLARKRLHVVAFIVCIVLGIPALCLCLLTLLNDMAARHSFLFHCSLHGMAGILGIVAVYIVNNAPPNKHTHPSMFLRGRRGHHKYTAAPTVNSKKRVSLVSPNPSRRKEQRDPSALPDHHKEDIISDTVRSPPVYGGIGGTNTILVSSGSRYQDAVK